MSPEAYLKLGGIESIRGYREEHFRVTRAGWTNLEWRVLLARRSRAFLFLDSGILGGTPDGGPAFYPAGYGGGLRVASRVGLIGLDYGLSRGDSPAQGKVHVQMVNEF